MGPLLISNTNTIQIAEDNHVHIVIAGLIVVLFQNPMASVLTLVRMGPRHKKTELKRDRVEKDRNAAAVRRPPIL